MKLTTLFATLSTLLIAFPVFSAPNLVDTWCVSMSEVTSGTGDQPGELGGFTLPDPVEEEIVIQSQDDYTYGTLFYGYVEHVPGVEYGYFSGVLDGKTISITHWDSVTRGELIQKGNKPMEIHFINNAFSADDRSAKTAIGIAVQGNCPLTP